MRHPFLRSVSTLHNKNDILLLIRFIISLDLIERIWHCHVVWSSVLLSQEICIPVWLFHCLLQMEKIYLKDS